jgi:hypothetical protein
MTLESDCLFHQGYDYDTVSDGGGLIAFRIPLFFRYHFVSRAINRRVRKVKTAEIFRSKTPDRPLQNYLRSFYSHYWITSLCLNSDTE